MGTYVKDSGTQRLVRYAFVKDSSVWQRCKRIWVKTAGVWQKAYEIEAPPAAETYTTTGTNIAWTKPSGYFDYMTVQIWGGGGAGETGSNDTAAGGGGGGAYVQFSVNFADVPATGNIVVGAGGVAVNVDNRQGGDGTGSSFLNGQAGGGGGGGVTSNAARGLAGEVVSPPTVPYFNYITENGGRGGPGTNSVQPAGNGDSTTYAGAGGGGGGETTGAQGGAGGTSTYGGNGGTGGGGNAANPQPTAGSAPGGGGGGDDGFGRDGARGEVRITYYTPLA